MLEVNPFGEDVLRKVARMECQTVRRISSTLSCAKRLIWRCQLPAWDRLDAVVLRTVMTIHRVLFCSFYVH